MRAYPSIRKTDGVGAGMAEYIEGNENPARGRRAGRTARGARSGAGAVGGVQSVVTHLHLELHRLPFRRRLAAIHHARRQAVTRPRTRRDTARDCATRRAYTPASPATARARGTGRDRRPQAV